MSMPFIHPDRRMNGGGGLNEFIDELPELARAGIGAVASLLNIPSDAKLYADAGFDFICLPVADGQPPRLEQVLEFIAFVDNRKQDRGVAVHCEAGCGRTGTMLCAYLIAKGEAPPSALNRVRTIEPSAVETQRQVGFLLELPDLLQGSKFG